MNRYRTLAALSLAWTLAACHEPAPPAEAPPPVLQGRELHFAAGHPQLARIAVAPAVPAHSVAVEMPAKIVWNEERTQRIYPAFAGRVARIAADVGQPVQPGTVLAVLASPDFGAAQADAAKAQVDTALTRRNLQRQRELFEAGIVARKDLDAAEADAARAQAEAQRALARTRLYGASAGVDQSLAIRAGVRGVVVERNITPGQELRPDQSGPGVPPLFVLSDPASLWVQIDARESEAPALQPGAAFEVSAPALGNERFLGRVTAVADFIDPNTRTIKVRGVIDNAGRKLKAEMLVTARVERTPGSGVLVPASAVSLGRGQDRVMVQVQPGVFEPRDVTVGYQGAREVLVSKGLAAGEQVVTDNLLLLEHQYSLAQDAAAAAAAHASGSAGK